MDKVVAVVSYLGPVFIDQVGVTGYAISANIDKALCIIDDKISEVQCDPVPVSLWGTDACQFVGVHPPAAGQNANAGDAVLIIGDRINNQSITAIVVAAINHITDVHRLAVINARALVRPQSRLRDVEAH